MGFKLVIPTKNGDKVWINPEHIVTMVKNREGIYFIRLVTGETFLIDPGAARQVENYFERKS